MRRITKIINFIILIIAMASIRDVPNISQAAENSLMENPAVYDADGLRDPFESPFKPPKEEKIVPSPEESKGTEVPKVTPPALVMRGIVWNSNVPQAIINERIVKIGDVLEGAHILEIKKEGVTIEFQDQLFVLPPPALNQDFNISAKSKSSDTEVRNEK